MSSFITVTSEGLKKLQEELAYLKSVKRKEVTEAIRVALSFGDLSENSEYDEAKTEQAKVETRIAELEELLKTVKLVSEEDIHTDHVSVGSHVKLHNITRDVELSYSIVGSTEANPIAGKISDQSPIGRALIGSSVGDTVTVETPAGAMQMKVLEIGKQSE